jgi:uncharacterized secreted protein with C-terminal beta-propeller domain
MGPMRPTDGVAVAPPMLQPVSTDTQIHKFDITGDSAKYVASGTVDGTLLNQFAMSEWNGDLRVASTSNSVSSVTVLAQRASALVPIGSVGGLGRGEQIRGVRFIGPVGYVVTFQQTDPLFTIDLSDPAKPKVAGELKIPGFSAYLHPVGAGLLLGIGEIADDQGHVHDDQGRWFGTKVSLFDVHDVARPLEIAKFEIPGTGPDAIEQDHHAFLWWEPRSMALVPFDGFDPQSDTGTNGVVALRVDRAIKELGRVTHPTSKGEFAGANGIERSAIIGDLLITFSSGGLMANDLSSFAQRAWLPFSGSG